MADKIAEIKRSYRRAIQENYPIILNKEGAQFYLDALEEKNSEYVRLQILADKVIGTLADIIFFGFDHIQDEHYAIFQQYKTFRRDHADTTK